MQSGKSVYQALIDSNQSVDSIGVTGNTALIWGLILNLYF
jgi:hypothetical protein